MSAVSNRPIRLIICCGAGWFSRISSVVTGSILSVFRYVYLAISTVLFFDTWLLRSGNASSPTKKRFLLLLLILLPMLLIAGK